MRTPENSIVLADVHGDYETAARALEANDLSEVQPIFAGDFINIGPDTAKILDLIIDSEAVALAGNHEWWLRNRLNNPPNERQASLIVGVPSLSSGAAILASYGIAVNGNRAEMRQALKEAMEERGHLGVLDKAPPYLELSDFIIIHAGVLNWLAWEEQKADLDAQSTPEKRGLVRPRQIFDSSHNLASIVDIPDDVTTKTVVSGHWHIPDSDIPRIYPKRIFLGSRPNEPLPVLKIPEREITFFDRAKT